MSSNSALLGFFTAIVSLSLPNPRDQLVHDFQFAFAKRRGLCRRGIRTLLQLTEFIHQKLDGSLVAGCRLVHELLERRFALRDRLLPAAFLDDYFLVERLVQQA